MRLLLALSLAIFVQSTPTGDCSGWTAGSATVCTYPADRLALNDIYAQLGGTNWVVKDLWDPASLDAGGKYVSDPCNGAREWFGVFCANRQGQTALGYKYGTAQNLAYRITTLAFADNNLRGTFPSSIYSMDLVANVFMSRNPFLVGTLTDSISGMTSLSQFQIDSCGFTGTLPQGLSSLLNLAKLYVQKNRFTGALPNLRTASQLSDWQLGGNQFTTTLPDYITQMTSLAKFDIRGDDVWKGVSGTIPLAWGTAAEAGTSPLRYLDVSHNDLSGIIPSAQLSSIGLAGGFGLQAFYFQNNRFSCVFPPFLGDLSRGILFNSSGNSFYCPYPDGISPAISNTGLYPIVDQCTQANISLMYVNGDANSRTCTRGDASGCVVSITGINFPINALAPGASATSYCPVIMSINIAVSDGAIPPRVTLTAERQIIPSSNTRTGITVDVAGAPQNLFTSITAGSKQLQLDIQMPDGTLFSPTGGQLPEPLFLLGVCNADCNGHGLCNALSETCQCEVGYYGSDCSLACDVPYISYTYTEINGINTSVPHQCNDRGLCAYNNILGRPVCTCTLASDGKNLWDGLYCERVSCDQVYCSADVNQGICDPSTGTCKCNDNPYVNITGDQCQTVEVVKDWCGEEAGTDLINGKDLPAGRGVFSYNLDTSSFTCTCTDKKWEPNTDAAYAAIQELNCDKKIPPTWPIYLGCILAGLLLIGIGIFVFLKIKKFDPEKKQKQMEMQALNN